MNEQITIHLDNLTEEEREQLKKLLSKASEEPSKESRVWIPEKQERYYYIDGFVNVAADNWDDYEVDIDRLNVGNVFRNSEQAEFVSEKNKVKAELERYALEHNDPEKEAWDGNNFHFEIACLYLSKECISVSTNTGPYRGESITYFTSKEIAEGAIKSVGKDRILKYLFDVDCEEETND